MQQTMCQSVWAVCLLIVCAVSMTSCTVTYGSNTLCVCAGNMTVNCAGDTSCTADCNGVIRHAEEQDCVFPFQYNGVWYDTCISTDKGFWWCSVTKVYTDSFAPCAAKCPILAKNIAGTGKTHSACATPSANKVSYPPNADLITQIVDYHNWVRSNVSANKNLAAGTYTPDKATYMRKLYWDTDLASLAQRWADRGIFEHDCNACRKLLSKRTISNGQNIYARSNMVDQTSLWTSAMSSWYNEINTWNYNTGGTGVTGHYVQMIWATTARVGCGMAHNPGQTYPYFVVCNYVGIVMTGSKPFTVGEACADCPNSCENNLCTCNKICQNGGILDKDACTCTCKAYATGAECEKLTCTGSDASYGCGSFSSSVSNCQYSNVPPICPHMCSICDYA